MSKKPRLRRIDNLEILSELGRGGMGIVYKAGDIELRRLVVLKFFLASVRMRGDDSVERFLREARAAAQFSHPNSETRVSNKGTIALLREERGNK